MPNRVVVSLTGIVFKFFENNQKIIKMGIIAQVTENVILQIKCYVPNLFKLNNFEKKYSKKQKLFKHCFNITHSFTIYLINVKEIQRNC